MSVGTTFAKEQVDQFKREGYLVIDHFLTVEECDILRKRCYDIVEKEDFAGHPTITFNTRDNQQASTDYFLTSGDKIRYFFEEGALDKDGKLTVPKHLAINKIGHALHELDPVFKDITTCERIKTIAKGLNFQHPAIVQSMYIFKQPLYGGSVRPHQDSTFLHTDPNSLTGFWIALEDADIENSCLWFAPGSHNLSVQKHMVRTVENDAIRMKFVGSDVVVDDKEFVAVPVKKGSLVMIDGSVVHKSEANTSKRSRHIYTFHLFDTCMSKWSEDNWLQPTTVVPFRPLY